jgi:hypothetical protein
VAKLRSRNEIGIDDLAILFDDTRGDSADLAAREAEIVHQALANSRASRVLVYPTCCCDDRMLDLVFGQRPDGCLQDLGRRLDARVGVYWTGEELCSREVSPERATAKSSTSASLIDVLPRWRWPKPGGRLSSPFQKFAHVFFKPPASRAGSAPIDHACVRPVH